jgi:hypothetical protein
MHEVQHKDGVLWHALASENKQRGAPKGQRNTSIQDNEKESHWTTWIKATLTAFYHEIATTHTQG